MTLEQERNYWRYHSRRHEATVKDRGDYDDLKTKAAEADRLRQAQETAAEKAVREASEQARAAALAEHRPALVAAEFRAAAAGRIDAARLATLTEDIDLTRYLGANGAVDVAKVTAKVAAWAPPEQERRAGVKPDPTQGARNGKTSGTDVGREMFENRRGRKPAAS